MHLIYRDLEIVIMFYEAQEIMKLLIMNVFQPPLTSSHIGPNISKPDILYSFCNVRDQVSDSYKTKGRAGIPYFFNLYKSAERDANKNDSDMNCSKKSLNLIFFTFYFSMQF